MSPRKTRFAPAVEALEDRRTPATLRLIGSTAFVLDPEGDLTVVADSGDLTVTDDTLSVTVPASRLIVQGTNGTDDVTFKAVTDFTGDVLLNLRGGSDAVAFKGGGTVLGDVTVLTGRGSDLVEIAAAGGGDFAGDVRLIDSRGDDTLNVATGGGKSEFLGDFSAVGYEEVDLGGAGSDQFVGDFSLTNVDGAGGTLELLGETSFLGDFNLTLGQGDDSIDWNNVDGKAGPAFGGDVRIDLGGGDNSLLSDPPAAQTVEGSVAIVAGGGVDDFDIDDSDLAVAGDFAVRAGDGDNEFLLQNFTVAGDLSVEAGGGDDVIDNYSALIDGEVRLDLGGGDNLFDDDDDLDDGLITEFTYLGGDGDNSVTLNDVDLGDVDVRVGNGANRIELDPFGVETIGGDVDIRVGNGGNVVEVSNDVAGRLTFVGGNGGDSLELGEAFVEGVNVVEFYNLNLTFGSGDDTLNFGGGDDTVSGVSGISATGVIDGGVGDNLLTEEGDGLTPVSPFTIRNFVAAP